MIKEYLIKYKNYLLYVIIGIIIIIGYFVYNNTNKENEEIVLEEKIEVVEEKEKIEEVEEIIENISIDIKGAVNKPGVYTLSVGSRVSDAIKISGGLTKNADTSTINLSKILNDEMVIIIYTKEEIEQFKKGNVKVQYIEKECVCPKLENNACIEDKITNYEEDKNGTSNNTSNTSSKVNINTAPISELTKLNGIGEGKAKAIIEYREKNGLFKDISEITNVSGIGNSTYEKIKDNITV